MKTAKTIQIDNIDQLTEIILSDEFNDKQIQKIIEKTFTVLYVENVPKDRKLLSEMVLEFWEKYGKQFEKPIFFGDLDLDVID